MKPLEMFTADKTRADGRKRECKACANERQKRWYAANPGKVRQGRMKQLFGLSSEQYKKIYKSQRGRCAICKVKLPNHLGDEKDLTARVAIDHDHKTGRVRGLLCSPCNKGIGFMKDDPKLLGAAIKYLTKGA